MRKIILVTISLDRMAGGLERNIVRIANYFVTQGDAVHLASFDTAPATAFFPLDSRVCWHKIGATRPHARIGFFARLALIRRLRAVIGAEAGERVFVIGFHHGILLRLWLAGLTSGARLICSERNSLSLYDHIALGKWNANFFMLYLTRKIVVQLEAYRRDYPRALQNRIVAIPNVVEPARVRAAPAVADSSGRFRLLAVGRLCDQKNYGCLLRAFAALAERFPAWDLTIAGDGPLLADLHRLVRELRLESRVSLTGAIADLAPQYGSAHLYCMPSKWEGFPNALAEAMAAGLPAVGFADCAGVRDLIAHGKSGLLAAGSGDAAALAAQLAELMADPSLRRAMGECAEQAMRRYRPENVYPLWDALLGERA